MEKEAKNYAESERVESEVLLQTKTEEVEYSLSLSERKQPKEESLSEKPKEAEYTRFFPSPRKVEEQLILSERQAQELIPRYREDLRTCIKNAVRRGELSEEKAEKRLQQIVIAQQGEEEYLLSTLCNASTGVTMEKVLRFIPEELYRQNRTLKALSDGKAYASAAVQLSLFPEIEQRALEESRRNGAPVLKYNAREWAKVICGTTNPKSGQIKQIERAMETLFNFRIYYPMENGTFYANTLLQHTGEIVGKHETYEYIRVAKFFALALTESKRGTLQADTGVVWKLSITEVSSVLGKSKIEWRLLRYLEYLYSSAYGDIKAKEKEGGERHSESIDTLLSKVASGAYTKTYASRSTNKSKALNDLRAALSKMEQLDIIKAGSLKEENGCFLWVWGNQNKRR